MMIINIVNRNTNNPIFELAIRAENGMQMSEKTNNAKDVDIEGNDMNKNLSRNFCRGFSFDIRNPKLANVTEGGNKRGLSL